jgi:hypothetical protein
MWVQFSPVHGKGKMFCSSCFNPVDAQTLRMRRGKARELTVCADCNNAVPVETKFGVCFSHVGDFDENEIPVTRFGQPILAGVRKCGYGDCINPEHCVSDPFLERFDTSYRTGVKLSPAEFYQALEKERAK